MELFSQRVCVALLALVVGCDGQPVKLEPCPKGCDCEGRRGPPGDCQVTVDCEHLKDFPKASEYPTLENQKYFKTVDCVIITGKDLQKLSPEAKAAGLKAIPASIRKLELPGAGLGELPEGALSRFTEIRQLNLEFNKLTKLSKTAFHGLQHLKILQLHGMEDPEYHADEAPWMNALANQIQSIDEAQFQGLAALQILSLNHNRLQSLPAEVFKGLPHLKVLKLQGNDFDPPITETDPALVGLPALYHLDLEQSSGDEMMEFLEVTRAFLSDEFFDGPPDPETELVDHMDYEGDEL